MARDRLGKAVVSQRGESSPRVRVEHLDTWRSERQQLDVDAILVHVGDPELIEVEQAIEEQRLARRARVDRSQQWEIETGAGRLGDHLVGDGNLGDHERLLSGDPTRRGAHTGGCLLAHQSISSE
jgi:topoisomerase IA-like protein